MGSNQNACPHPHDDGGVVCDPQRPEPGDEWPLRVWSCWWLHRNLTGPAFSDRFRERPDYHRKGPPPPRRPALH